MGGEDIPPQGKETRSWNRVDKHRNVFTGDKICHSVHFRRQKVFDCLTF